jgi:hypothetical protein
VNVSLLRVGLRTSMPVIDLTGFDTQSAPMGAIAEVLNDYHGGFTNSVETLSIVNAIVTEWRQ